MKNSKKSFQIFPSIHCRDKKQELFEMWKQIIASRNYTFSKGPGNYVLASFRVNKTPWKVNGNWTSSLQPGSAYFSNLTCSLSPPYLALQPSETTCSAPFTCVSHFKIFVSALFLYLDNGYASILWVTVKKHFFPEVFSDCSMMK